VSFYGQRGGGGERLPGSDLQVICNTRVVHELGEEKKEEGNNRGLEGENEREKPTRGKSRKKKVPSVFSLPFCTIDHRTAQRKS